MLYWSVLVTSFAYLFERSAGAITRGSLRGNSLSPSHQSKPQKANTSYAKIPVVPIPWWIGSRSVISEWSEYRFCEGVPVRGDPKAARGMV